jgi:hypothetical protein
MVVPHRHFYSCNALRILRSSLCLRVLRFTRSLSYCLQLLLIPHGSSCVLHSPSLNRSFITFHSTSFADPSLLLCLVPKALAQYLHTDRATCTSASHHTPLTGLHSTSFRRVSFSTVQSTRCHTFFARRPPLQAAFSVCC